MKIFNAFIIVWLLLNANAYAQTKTVMELKTDSIGSKVIQYLGDHQPDSIYMLVDDNFKNEVSAESFTSVCQNQLFPLNDFKNVAFAKTINGINKYKVNGTPALQLLVGLDSNYKIATLLVQPYKDE